LPNHSCPQRSNGDCSRYVNALQLLLPFLREQTGNSANVISRNSPLTVTIAHRADGLHGGALALELRVKLEDDVLTVGCAGQLSGGMAPVECAGSDGAEWRPYAAESAGPLILGDGVSKEGRGFRPASCCVACIYEREPVTGCALGRWIVVGH
jgi:hypothetical protein